MTPSEAKATLTCADFERLRDAALLRREKAAKRQRAYDAQRVVEIAAEHEPAMIARVFGR